MDLYEWVWLVAAVVANIYFLISACPNGRTRHVTMRRDAISQCVQKLYVGRIASHRWPLRQIVNQALGPGTIQLHDRMGEYVIMLCVFW